MTEMIVCEILTFPISVRSSIIYAVTHVNVDTAGQCLAVGTLFL